MSRLMLVTAIALSILACPAISAQQSPAQQTRDWSAIDTNHDHYISPEEMQKYLDGVWAQHAKKRQ